MQAIGLAGDPVEYIEIAVIVVVRLPMATAAGHGEHYCDVRSGRPEASKGGRNVAHQGQVTVHDGHDTDGHR